MKPERLDELLRGWSATREPDAARTEDLHGGLRRRLEAERFLEIRDMPHQRSFARYVPGLSLASAVLLVLACMLHFAAPSGDGARVAAPSARELAACAEIYNGVADVFGDRLGWIDLSASDVRLGISPDRAAVLTNTDTRPLLVRFDVMKRGDDGKWHSVSRREVIARAGLPASMADDGGNTQASLWIHPVSDDKLFIETTLDLADSALFAGDSAIVMKPGSTKELMRVNSDGREYRLYQSVSWLPAARGETT